MPEERGKLSASTTTSKDGKEKSELMRHRAPSYSPTEKLNQTTAAITPDTVFDSHLIGICNWQENAHIWKLFSSNFCHRPQLPRK